MECGMMDNIHRVLWIMGWWRYFGTWNSGYIVEQGMVEI